MTEDEVRRMFRLLKKHAAAEMDQFDWFKFDDAHYGSVYVHICREIQGSDELCIDVNHLIADD